MQRGLVNRVLVICPLSIMKSAWQNDLFKFAIHRTVTVAYGAAQKRKQLINMGADFVVINFDGVGIVKKEIIAGGFDLIVVDEASAYKNAQTDRWKDLRDLTKVIKGLWMLTGTPAAQSPADAYGLAKLVNPTGVPQFFSMFRDSVMLKMGLYRWIPKPPTVARKGPQFRQAREVGQDQTLSSGTSDKKAALRGGCSASRCGKLHPPGTRPTSGRS
jgi:hypothetical protein